jgi:sterol desaturase/sphingolipid hydroxylase (fatty acid hydroxylase superfamily)
LVPPTKSYDPFLWAHIVHHSSDNFNLGTAVRNGWFTIFINLSLCLDSNHWFPARNAGCLHIEALWQFQLHTPCKKIGFIEKFLTHTMHQVHHAQNIEYMDKTMVVFLMFLIEFWDLKQLDESIIQYGFLYLQTLIIYLLF